MTLVYATETSCTVLLFCKELQRLLSRRKQKSFPIPCDLRKRETAHVHRPKYELLTTSYAALLPSWLIMTNDAKMFNNMQGVNVVWSNARTGKASSPSCTHRGGAGTKERKREREIFVKPVKYYDVKGTKTSIPASLNKHRPPATTCCPDIVV